MGLTCQICHSADVRLEPVEDESSSSPEFESESDLSVAEPEGEVTDVCNDSDNSRISPRHEIARPVTSTSSGFRPKFQHCLHRMAPSSDLCIGGTDITIALELETMDDWSFSVFSAQFIGSR